MMIKDGDDLEEIDQKDDGYIELVLRVLARMCDGQHKGLQVRLYTYTHSLLILTAFLVRPLQEGNGCITSKLIKYSY